MSEKLIQTRVAFLESQVDYLETELLNLDDLLIRCGFPEGIKTLKMTVSELLGIDSEHSDSQSL